MDSTTISAYLAQYPEVTWALVAMVFFVLEAAVATGVGFFFGALGGLTLSFLLITGIVQHDTSMMVQFGAFFLLTAIWTAILWKPLKNRAKRQHHYDSYAGTKATVVDSALLPKKQGRVKWSGAVMAAKLAQGQDAIPVGEEVLVVSQSESILTVTRHS